ncbi:MAG: 4Fe-4S dicluster domain-containing protein [Sulfolobales archaeon]
MGLQSKHIVLDLDKCTGCRICELVCSFYKHKKFSPKMSAIKVYYNYELYRAEGFTVCSQCGYCVSHCPTGALAIVNGIVVINYEICSGCLTCVKTCPIGALITVDGRPFKCDLCFGNPYCAKYCTRGAIHVS